MNHPQDTCSRTAVERGGSYWDRLYDRGHESGKNNHVSLCITSKGMRHLSTSLMKLIRDLLHQFIGLSDDCFQGTYLVTVPDKVYFG